MSLSRRDFLMRVGRAGGYSAAFLGMQSMGLMPAPAEMSVTLDAAPGIGKGVKVVILGGGISGLVAAYEMKALGYDCTVLEARPRPGGRNWTVRGGDTIAFLDGSTQTCTFDPGNYQNVGPARLPSIHKQMLDYCRKLGVELQVEVNTSRSTLLQNDAANAGNPMVQRQVVNDTRGHVSELLAKCVRNGALDQEITPTDRDRMLSFLRLYGSLDNAGKYGGSEDAGYIKTPGAGDVTGTLSQPIDMHTLLDANFWDGILFEEQFEMQATMFQPVGGMDRIPYAFAKALGGTVQYNSPVTEIRKTAKGVRIGYTQAGRPKSIEADFCFCGLPLMLLKKTPNDFSAPYKKVIAECAYANAYKIAWESRRFWEQEYNIYGGLEFLSTGCSPVWFPSGGLFAASWSAATASTPPQSSTASASMTSSPRPVTPSSAFTPATAGNWRSPSTLAGRTFPGTKAHGSTPMHRTNLRPLAARSAPATRPSSSPTAPSTSSATTSATCSAGSRAPRSAHSAPSRCSATASKPPVPDRCEGAGSLAPSRFARPL